MKIAICDDEKVAAEYIGEVLETYFKDKSMEYSIELYNSGETLMALQDKIMTYDVVFLDVDMPDADGFEVGEHIQLWGRIQSREYQKQTGDDEYETRVAYEISVSKLDRVEESGEVTAASEIAEETKEDQEETLDL